MKSLFKILLLFLLLLFGTNESLANIQLKIRDTSFNCDQLFSGEGYSGCTLEVYLRIEDNTYSSKYSNYTYKVECDATFTYYTSGLGFPFDTRVTDNIRIYGTNVTKTLYMHTTFPPLDPVYKVNVSSLSCKVKDIY